MAFEFDWTPHARSEALSAPIPRPSHSNHPVVAATNELIHPVVERLFSRFLSQFDPEQVRHYANHEHAVGRVACYLGTTPAQVLLTAGSDAAIQMVLTAMGRASGRLLLQWPNYRGYEAFARLAGLVVHRVDTFRLSPQVCEEALSRALAHLPPALVVITNPSGVDGSHLDLEAVGRLSRLAASCGHAMVLDEAYVGFSDLDHRPLLRCSRNLIILRSFSKMAGLAGLRVAAVAAGDEWAIGYLRKWFPENPVSVIAAGFLCFCLDREAELIEARAEVVRGREEIRAEARARLPDWSVPPSAGNFVYLGAPSSSLKERTFRAFEVSGIAVRDVDMIYPGARALRVTVGHAAFCGKLVDVLRGAVPSFSPVRATS